MTETENSLSMITKAGVPSNKVLVGVASYGRSFKMAEPGCTGPRCRFVGIGEKHESAAKPGMCTKTAGYLSDYEIRQIIREYNDPEDWSADEDMIAENPHMDYVPEGVFKSWYDEDSQSDIVVYGETEWVAWMDTETKRSRVELYKKLNFRGVSDWAIDLAGGHDPTANSDEDAEAVSEVNCDFDLKFSDLQDLENNGGGLSSYCSALYTLEILADMFANAISKYEDLDKDYDAKFDYYVKVVKATATANLNKCLSWTDSGPCNKHFTCTWRQDGEDKETGKCPLSKYEVSQDKSFIITYEMDDEAGFNKTLEEDFGVSPDWVEMKDILNDSDCNGVGPPPGANPRPQEDEPGLEKRQCIQVRQEYKNRPVLREDAKIPNPKDVIKEASENFEDILLEISGSYLELLLGIWDGDRGELVEAISMPVLMVVQSVEVMESVKEIGDEV